MTLREVARELGSSKTPIVKALKALGVERRPRPNIADFASTGGRAGAGRPRIQSNHRVYNGPGERLYVARIAAGLTQEQLGAIVGRSRSYILQIERGTMNPNEEVALALMDVLNLPRLFDLRPCPCVPWCGARTVGGGFAEGHRGFTDEERRRGGRKNKGRPRPDQSERIRAANRERRGPWWDSEDGARFLGLFTSGEIRPTCWLCGTEKALAPARFAVAWRAGRRLVCGDCGPTWIAALGRARGLARKAATDMEALENCLSVARDFETDLRARQRPRRGQPRHVALDLTIEALFVDRRLSHGNIAHLLTRAVNKGWLENPAEGATVPRDYVKTRQRRARITRRF